MNDSGNTLRLQLFAGTNGINHLYPEWVGLANRVRALHLMQLPDYYLSYAEMLAPTPDEMLIAAFYDDEGLAAVLPLRFARRAKLGIKYGLLEFPRTPMPIRGFVASDRLRFGRLVACLANQFAIVHGEQWDILRLVGVVGPVSDKRTTDATPTIITTAVARGNYIQLYDGDYVQDRLSVKNRNNLRRRMKRLATRGHVEFKTISCLPELYDAYEAFVETEAAGWKSRRGGKRAIKLHPDQSAFYRNLLVRFASMGNGHVHLLEVDGHAIAAELCLLAGNAAYSLKSGYDESFADVSPSHLLREYTIQYYSNSEDIRIIDLISGYAWQEQWKPDHRQVPSVVTFNRTLRGRIWQAYMQIKARRSKGPIQ